MEETERGNLLNSLTPGQNQLYASNLDVCLHSSYIQLMTDNLQPS